ncbi:CHAT domain-containing protein [Thermoleptolyngbya sichuanensis XZ-Cy5]|uniref:CHAT domain-containing protein n=1 Tax=Thermoleptolyngbya sichuanensis TaxID=2885951 RepID=UPI00240D59B9|nr:CHAT domain-containing protein [Thermoleptolyngbya sichuanensis]MDG2615205.1 CHAT domain-containing protein [Thermoleptolyngbya sichuanensis XZ-Cy5]
MSQRRRATRGMQRGRLLPEMQQWRRGWHRLLCLGLGLLTVGLCMVLPLRPGWGQAVNPAAQVQQGIDRYRQGDYLGAIALWEAVRDTYRQQPNPAHEAILTENLARARQAIGQQTDALSLWQTAGNTYRQLAAQQPDRAVDYTARWGRSLTEQAQIYNRIGQYRKAVALLCGEEPRSAKGGCGEESAVAIAQHTADHRGESAAWGSLGQAHRLMGNDDSSKAALDRALSLARTLNDRTLLAATYSNLGALKTRQAVVRYRQANSAEPLGDVQRANRLRDEGRSLDQSALQDFQQSLDLATQPTERLRVLLDAIPAYDRTGNVAAAQNARQSVKALLNQLPTSQDTLLAALDWVRLLMPASPQQPIARSQCFPPAANPGVDSGANFGLNSGVNTGANSRTNPGANDDAKEMLNSVASAAERLGDRRSLSFALGELGHWHECQKEYQKALDITQDARLAAEYEYDSRYLWEWQTGRILQAQGQTTESIAAYERAIATLEIIRDDILVANRDIQFDFRDSIDPVHRELVALRLKQGKPSELLPPASTDRPDTLSRALGTLDSLKLAELQNYFGDDCVLTSRNVDLTVAQKLLTEGDRTAVISTVVLDDQTAVLLTLPNGDRQYEWINTDRQTLRDEINAYRRGLEVDFRAYDPQPAQRLYDQIIRPFEALFQQQQVETLAFVQDDILRSVPMSALHDGTQFLIQKYAIAYMPSLQLTSPVPLDRGNLRALAAGLTDASPPDSEAGGFSPLFYVSEELDAILAELPRSRTLTGSAFRLDNLAQTLFSNNFPILHIATHGIFGTEAEDTFLVTADPPENKLTLNQLDRLLRGVDPNRPVQLLSLTACTTAVGDDRAALGLAGVAAQAGVRSVLASLWFVNDAATSDLIKGFYADLKNPSLSKAKALQQAQIQLIESGGKFARPAYWAPFILVGNWL